MAISGRDPAFLGALALLGALADAGCKTKSVPAETATFADAAISDAEPIATDVQLDGRDFPDGVLALTWDDGPDTHTLELARYLKSEGVSGTFFVVHEWKEGVSSDPGEGTGVYASGYARISILEELTRLGHRLGNHTSSHVLLAAADAPTITRELGENQARIDPFLDQEVRFFRVPGGAWGSEAATTLSRARTREPLLRTLVGPIRWDVDRKDWEEALYCRSSAPDVECERAAPGGARRLKATVTAAHYAESIDAAKHGIVLMHDRVGHVGSTYALELARALIPRIRAHGYVLAAPILAFSALVPRGESGPDEGAFMLGDVNGDGRADLCRAQGDRMRCAISVRVSDKGALPTTRFEAQARWGTDGAPGRAALADVNGDGRADLCVANASGVGCRLAEEAGHFAPFPAWSTPSALGSGAFFGDLDGDRRADACVLQGRDVFCARSSGSGFERAGPWLTALPEGSESAGLADVSGDGRADLCVRVADSVMCAPARGGRDGFAPLVRWGALPGGALLRGDVNGDGKSDVCATGGAPNAVRCALSRGDAFLGASIWLRDAAGLEGAALADVNGDGRADLCGVRGDVVCALAP